MKGSISSRPKQASKTKRRRHKADPSLSRIRSALTNGSKLLTDCDHRSAWMRRLRDLIEGHISDGGGIDQLSTAEQSIIRRASMLELQMEVLESRFAEKDGVASTDQLLLYQRTANSCRRLLESVGLKRKAKDVTLDPLEYSRTFARRKADAEDIEEVPA